MDILDLKSKPFASRYYEGARDAIDQHLKQGNITKPQATKLKRMCR